MLPAAEFFSVPVADYHADRIPGLEWVPTLNHSIAHTLISRSPMHAWFEHPRLGGHGRAVTEEMERGKVLHSMILEPDQAPGIQIIDAPDFRTKLAREQRDAARAEGQVPMLARHVEQITDIAGKIKRNINETGIVFDGDSEIMAKWPTLHQDVPGVPYTWNRAMLDHWLIESPGCWSGATIYDLKTTERITQPRNLAAQALRFGYDIQAAAYLEAAESIYPDLAGRIQFIFVFSETEPPYGVYPACPSGSFLELGRRKWARASRTWAECLASNTWPSFPRTNTLEAPMWALYDEMAATGETEMWW